MSASEADAGVPGRRGLNDPRSYGSPVPGGEPSRGAGAKPDDASGSGAAGKDGAAGKAATWRPARNSWLTIVVALVVVATGVLMVLAAWRLPPFATPQEPTEDAYVSGRTTLISPQLSGYVLQAPADDFAQVRQGEVLVRIDPQTYRQEVEQARADRDVRLANLANNRQTLNRARAEVASQQAAIVGARAQLIKARTDLARSSDLVRDGSVSPRENDQNVAAVRQAQASVAQDQAAREAAVQQVRSVQVNGAALAAQVRQAEASLEAAQLQLDRTVIVAPVDGRLSEVGVRVGQYVTAGTQLFFLVPPEIWITANFKEAQTRRMAVGQPASFTADALGDRRVHGHVDRMSPATGSQFAVLKPNNATGNFVKVPQRISVRILVDEGQPLAARLKPGMSLAVRVDTSGGGAGRR